MDLLSVVILAGVFFYCIFNFFLVINYFRVGDLLNNYNLKLLFQDIVFVHSGLITSGFLLVLYALFKKKMMLIEFTLITLLGFFSGLYGYMDTVIHESLFNSGVYGFLMREGQSILNPQYTRIFLYIAVLLLLFFVIILSKAYKLQRVFIFLIGASILSTTIIFHFAIPMGYFKFVRNNALYEMGYEIQNKEIKDICKQKNCVVFDSNWKVVFKDDEISEDFLEFYDPQIAPIRDMFDKFGAKYYSNFLSNFRGNTFDYVPVIVVKGDNNFILITDESLTTGYSRISELVFVSITVVAHLFWYFLGFALYILHSGRKIYRLSV